MAEMDFEKFLLEHQDFDTTGNRYDSLPLNPKTRNDFMLQAQMRQLDVQDAYDWPTFGNVSLGRIMGINASEELNQRIPDSFHANRLAFSAVMLCALDDRLQRSLNMKSDSALTVSGQFLRFTFGFFEQNESLAVQLIDPFFIDPELDGTPDPLLQIDSIAIPVLGINNWGIGVMDLRS